MSQPVIIDCDPGTDDAIALVMATAAPELDVKAITTVAGNQTGDKTLKNALHIVSHLSCSIPVSEGATKPIMRPLVTAGHVHGESGLGPVSLPDSYTEPLTEKAWDLFYRSTVVEDKAIHLITLGPLTNIAIALMKYPAIRSYISRITMMGGSAGYGNDTPAAEYNIYADPEAAKMVFASGVPITMVGLDCTHQAWITDEEIKELEQFHNKGAWLACEMMKHIGCFSRKFGFPGAVMHDPAAVAAVINPRLIKTQDWYVTVETKGRFTTGKTVVDVMNVTGNPPNVQVATHIDRSAFVQLVRKALKIHGQ